MASFSFQSSKNLTAGEGGIITTNDDALAEACRSIHNCGRVPDGIWYEHHVIAGNYRLGEFQGALLNCQLDRLEDQTATRDAQRPVSRVAARGDCPGSTRRRGRRDVHATQLSPVHAAPRRAPRSARRARRCCGRSRPRASRAPPATASRCPTSRCSATRRSARTCPARPRGWTTARTQCPNSDLICREQAIWLGQNLLLGARAATWTTSPARSRRSTSIARAWRVRHFSRLMRTSRAAGLLQARVAPSLARLSDNTYLSAIRAGMVAVVPLTIVGGLFMIVAYLPVSGWDAPDRALSAAAPDSGHRHVRHARGRGVLRRSPTTSAGS